MVLFALHSAEEVLLAVRPNYVPYLVDEATAGQLLPEVAAPAAAVYGTALDVPTPPEHPTVRLTCQLVLLDRGAVGLASC